jgi:lactoylglutathione lyase
MAKFTLDHMHIRSPDPDATAVWFERMFGAEVIRTMPQGKPRIDLKIDGTNIYIAPAGPGTGVNPAPDNPHQGLDHFGLRVADIDAVFKELKDKGVNFTVEPYDVRADTRIAFLRTPEGVLIELLQRR